VDKQGWLRRSLVRVINDDNLDLYLLGTVALVFTVLGITGVSDVKRRRERPVPPGVPGRRGPAPRTGARPSC
jgi:hypothetical protein